MRTFRHWTPRYLYSRIVEKIYRRRNPGLPWLTQDANRILETLLLPTDAGLEFGSGRSTFWFAARVAHLTSVEHNPDWYMRVGEWLKQSGLENVDYILHAREGEEADINDLPAYVCAANTLEDESLDFALVDGIYRDACALVALRKLKPGGVLVIDNANLYLPCRSSSPNSIPLQGKAATPMWQQFAGQAADWRKLWTSNSVSDTAFFFKPC